MPEIEKWIISLNRIYPQGHLASHGEMMGLRFFSLCTKVSVNYSIFTKEPKRNVMSKKSINFLFPVYRKH